MDNRKQYTEEVIINIIHFMAQAGAGIKPSKEEIDQIPEEFHKIIVVALSAARDTKRIQALATMSKSFPIEDFLNIIRRHLKED